MKMFKVKIVYETVILEEDEKSVKQNADYHLRYCDDLPQSVTAEEIKSLGDLPAGWDGRCRPWGKRNPMDWTIAEQLEYHG